MLNPARFLKIATALKQLQDHQPRHPGRYGSGAKPCTSLWEAAKQIDKHVGIGKLHSFSCLPLFGLAAKCPCIVTTVANIIPVGPHANDACRFQRS